MDFWFIATVSALLLITVDPVESSNETSTTTPNTTITETSPQNHVSPEPTVNIMGFITVKWTHRCRGEVILNTLKPNSLNFSSSLICHNKSIDQLLSKDLCENKKGCEGEPSFPHRGGSGGYSISANQEMTYCETLRVKCTEVRLTKVPTEPVGYKVATALLCCLLLLLLLIRFSRPTVKALQKRRELSNKRQNRWIGPTQSHSVSYHRGQTTLSKNLDNDSRRSYSALDQLAVGNREPSSNRNSYNF